MSTAYWPFILPDCSFQQEIDQQLINEWSWLIDCCRIELNSVGEGLQECLNILRPSDSAITLALSSTGSETVKGIVTRSGFSITRAYIKVQIPSFTMEKSEQSFGIELDRTQAPFEISQLRQANQNIKYGLLLVNEAQSMTYASDRTIVLNQVQRLVDTIQNARAQFQLWQCSQNPAEDPDDFSDFDSINQYFNRPLPSNLRARFGINGSSFVLEIGVVDISRSNSSFRDDVSAYGNFQMRQNQLSRFSSPFSSSVRSIVSDNLDMTPSEDSCLTTATSTKKQPLEPGRNIHNRGDLNPEYYPKGSEGVFKNRAKWRSVSEKVVVEAPDPDLIALEMKLLYLENSVTRLRDSLQVVLGSINSIRGVKVPAVK